MCTRANSFRVAASVLIFFTSALLFSCKDNNVGFTGDHLPSKVMQKVMLDINLAESYSTMEKDSLHKFGQKNADSLAVHYRNIFAHYHITAEQFSESLKWYKNHPEHLDSLYNNMMPIVTKWQDDLAPKGAPAKPLPPPPLPVPPTPRPGRPGK